MSKPREFDTCVVCDRDFAIAADTTVMTHGPRNARCPGSRRLGVQVQQDTRIALGWAPPRVESGSPYLES